MTKPSTSPFSMYSDETIIERFAPDTQALIDAATAVAPADVSVGREVLVARTVADGVLNAISRTDARMLVVGWHERRARTDALFGTTLDRLIKHAPCDLFVERIGYEANGVNSILVPVAGGPHVRPATVVAKAIAARNTAPIHVLAVAGSTDETAMARANLDTAVRLIEDAPGPDVEVKTVLESGGEIVKVIVEAATDHDVVIFGVSRQSAIRRRLLGSIPQAVIPRIDETVVLARSAVGVGRPWFSDFRRRLRGS